MNKTRYDYEEQHRADSERIKELESEVKSLNFELMILRNDIKQASKLKNERGAGRKPKLTKPVMEQIKKLRNEGLTQSAIARQVQLSIGAVNKACKLLKF